MTTPQHSLAEVVEVLQYDLWNDHRYQLEATANFYKCLYPNVERGVFEGDESSLTSSLIHARSLLDFYNPRTDRRDDDIWWATGLGALPPGRTTADAWEAAISQTWPGLKDWATPTNKFVAHLTWDRRTIVLQQDDYEQRYPLLGLATGCLWLLGEYVAFVREHGTLRPDVLKTLEAVHDQATQHWRDRESWTLPSAKAQAMARSRRP